MKLLKVTLSLAIFTFLLSSLGVGAIQGQQAYVVELAALKKRNINWNPNQNNSWRTRIS